MTEKVFVSLFKNLNKDFRRIKICDNKEETYISNIFSFEKDKITFKIANINSKVIKTLHRKDIRYILFEKENSSYIKTRTKFK
jgi:bifunctional DNase/RNase